MITNNKGFSLIEAIVGSAILLTISLSFMKFMQIQSRGVKANDINSMIDTVSYQILNLTRDEIACWTNFMNRVPGDGSTDNLTRLVAGPGTNAFNNPPFLVGRLLHGGSFYISDISLLPAAYVTQSGVAVITMRVTFEKTSQGAQTSVGATRLIRDFPLSVRQCKAATVISDLNMGSRGEGYTNLIDKCRIRDDNNLGAAIIDINNIHFGTDRWVGECFYDCNLNTAIAECL